MGRQGGRLPRLRGKDERGAVAVLVALLLVVTLSAAAFTIDLGQQRVGRADMQSLADVVALDLARELDGRSYSTLNPLMADLAAKSEARNQSVIGYADHLPALTVTLGTWDASATPSFTAVTSGTPNAVKVAAQTTVGFAFGGITGTDSGNATRTAYGTASNESCVKVGSYAARINSSNSALLNAVVNKALGGNLNLDALSYQGLANANVSLLDLATQLGVGTVDQLLTTSVSLKNLYLASAQVLQQNGNTAAATILSNIAASITLAHNITLGSLISAASGGGAAETASVDALGLLQTTAAIANGSTGVDIPSLSANLGLVSATGKLTLIQGPQVGCGTAGSSQAKASTAQATLSVSGTVNPTTIASLSVSGITTVLIKAASANAALSGVVCGTDTVADPSGDTIDASTGLLSATVGQTLTISGPVTGSSGGGGLNLSGLLGGIGNLLTSLLDPVVKVTVDGTLLVAVTNTSAPTTKNVTTNFLPNTPGAGRWSAPVDTGTGDLGLTTVLPTVTWKVPPTIKLTGLLGDVINPTATQLSAITDNLLSVLSSGVSSVATNVLQPVVTQVQTSLLTPLQGLLGLSLGGSDVWGMYPQCGSPKLVG